MRFTFSLSWKASAKKANIRERHWNMRQYRFVAHSFFLHTNTLIKKSLFEFDGFDTSFFYVRDYVLQLVSPHTLSLSVVRITALSSSAVLKSIFNSVLTRVPFYSVSHVHIEHIETEKRIALHRYIFYKPF